MREIDEVKVTSAIIHLVAPKQNRLVLSEVVLPDDPEVFGFLGTHVQGGLHDPQAKAVRFVVLGSERASGLCDRMLDSDEDFIAASQGLAKLLHQVTQSDKRISDGALIVMMCRAAKPVDLRFVALLKLDPSKAYRPVESKDSSGKTVVRLELEKDILPSERERLQKAAFIRKAAPKQEYRVLALDRQTVAEPAQFFISKYLGAEYVLDTEERTERLHRSLVSARNDAAPQLNSSQLVALDKVIEGTLASVSVNLDDLVASLPVRPEIREQIDAVVSEVLPDREFDLDAGLGARLVSKRRFEADNGVRVIVPAEFYDQMVKVEDVPNTSPRLRRVVITTTRWEEK